MAIRSVLEPRLFPSSADRPHWIVSAVEHDSVLQMIDEMRDRGCIVDLLPADSESRPKTTELAALIRPDTALISCIWVNNETGVITDLKPMVEAARANGVKVHLDAAQVWGKLPMQAERVEADFLALSGHKIGGLPGSGALWARDPSDLRPLFPGKQESGRRGGTENLLGAIAMGAAASALRPDHWAARVAPLRTRLEDAILRQIPGTQINGAGADRIANTVSLTFEGVRRPGLVPALDLAGFAVSAGSACSSGATQASHVLRAMGWSAEAARGSLRISLPGEVEWADLERFIDALARAVGRARSTEPSKD